MKRLNKVLILVASKEFGGVEKSLINVLNILLNNGFEVEVLSVFNCKMFKDKMPQNCGYRYIFESYFRGIDRFFRIMPSYLLNKIFIRNRYNYIIAYQEGIPAKIAVGNSEKNTKIICWFHNDPKYHDPNLFYYASMDEEIKHIKKFNCCISVSDYIRNQYEKYFNNKIEMNTIYNPLDEKLILEKAKEKITYPFKDGIKMCCIGRLSEEKRFEIAVQALNSLKGSKYSVNLTIVGSGSKKIYLDSLTKLLGLENEVCFIEHTDNPYSYMKNADMLVCTSKTESFSLTVAEAMILEKFIVSTKCGGPEELLDSYKYKFMLKNDEEDMKNNIINIIETYNDIMKVKNDKETTQMKYMFSYEAVEKQLIELLKNVTSR